MEFVLNSVQIFLYSCENENFTSQLIFKSLPFLTLVVSVCRDWKNNDVLNMISLVKVMYLLVMVFELHECFQFTKKTLELSRFTLPMLIVFLAVGNFR